MESEIMTRDEENQYLAQQGLNALQRAVNKVLEQERLAELAAAQEEARPVAPGTNAAAATQTAPAKR